MKPRKQTILIMLLGLLLFAFAAAMAQNPTQGDQKKPAESCCSMESCCSGDSCDMKAKDDMKSQADDQSCCACCGDSCDMSKHDATMKHDTKGHKDCCNMKQKDKTKTKKAA